MKSTAGRLGRAATAAHVCRVVISLIVLAGVIGTPPAAVAQEGRPVVKSLLEMRRENVIIQKWDLSCGAAALATLLNYQHGDPVPEREVTKALIQRDKYLANPQLVRAQEGFSLLDLKRYVDQRGYEGVGYGKLTLDDLVERAPIMVPINTHGYNHFVIFRGMLDDRVLLADSAWGNRTMTIDQFQSAWVAFPEFGRVGFVVVKKGANTGNNRLVPRPEEFVFLR